MAGAVVLGFFGVMACIGGMGFFIVAQSAVHEIEGLVMFLMATVLLSAAVIAGYLDQTPPKRVDARDATPTIRDPLLDRLG